MFNLLPIIVTFGGGYMLIKLRTFFILYPVRSVKELRSTLSSAECRRSLLLALAGTLGVGNVVGVAAGIIVGGAGSIFWLLISSLFASVLKYSESTLATDFKAASGNGMIDVLKSSFRRGGNWLACLYALSCLLLAFSMGAALQTSSIFGGITYLYEINRYVVAFILSVITFFVAKKGKKRISLLTSIMIPTSSLLYVLLCLSVIILHLDDLPSVVSLIFKTAFSFDGIKGGAVGFACSEAIRQGYSRGLMSNEAGAGTSSLAHSENDVHPASAGMMGICEVIVDTVILCPLTGIAILLSVNDPQKYSSGISLIMDSIGSAFGSFSECLIIVCIVSFAFSTVICWYYYGFKCLSFLLGGCERLYAALFAFSVFFGCILTEKMLILISDSMLLILSVLSVSVVMKCSDRIKYLSEQKGLIPPRRKCRATLPLRRRK